MIQPFLTDDEIADLGRPLVQPRARAKHLQSMGLVVKKRPDGAPVVGRKHFEEVMGAKGPHTVSIAQPDVGAVIQMFRKGARA